MTPPKEWSRGESITAARLNSLRDESLRPRRDVNVGNAFSMVNESLGNQSINQQAPLFRLAIATENFKIPDERTDLAVQDDVPSALCKMMRLIRDTATHQEEEQGTEFRCWDVIGGLNNGVLRQSGDVIYVMFNRDSKRWEVLQSASIRLVPGIVLCCLGGGWHKVELTDWNEIPDSSECIDVTSESVSDDVSGDTEDCDLCALIEGDSDAEAGSCTGSDVEVDRETGDPTGDIVYAHTTRLSPMMIGGLIKMLKRNVAETSESASVSVSASDEITLDKIYDVVDPVFPLISLPFPDYECCTDPVTGVQEVILLQCNKAVVEGYWCAGERTECPTAGSGSG